MRRTLLALTLVALLAPAAAPLGARPLAEGGPCGARVWALRLGPGQDLRRELEGFRRERSLRAAFVVSAVGSLREASLRLAGRDEATRFEGPLEIVSLSGTLSPDGPHLHLSASDGTGRTVGGHLVEGCPVYTTAEVVVADAEGLEFARPVDPGTGFHELEIRARPPEP